MPVVEPIAIHTFINGLKDQSAAYLVKSRNLKTLVGALSDALEVQPSSSSFEPVFWARGRYQNSFSNYNRGQGHRGGRGNNHNNNRGYHNSGNNNQHNNNHNNNYRNGYNGYNRGNRRNNYHNSGHQNQNYNNRNNNNNNDNGNRNNNQHRNANMAEEKPEEQPREEVNVGEFFCDFDREGLILSAAVASTQFIAEKFYDIKRVSAALRFLNIMTFDMHGAWDNYCGLNSPLYEGSADKTDIQKQLNVNASIHYWLSQGTPKEKIILGIPLFGRSFTLVNPDDNQIGAATIGPGIAGQYSRKPGVIGYNEFCEKQQSELWLTHFNEEQKGVYATRGNQWVSYEIALKMKYLLNMDLGGAMVWALESDDFLGVCNDSNYVLMNTIYRALHNGTEAPTVPYNSCNIYYDIDFGICNS
ncbi:chitotriosidase-1-like [Topomyia yanbarensis]|uniref:chitotriosidase-1-like n=1 Tax=Topomyia yanbarensis TaxID=2498891 RepID=UPI00273A7871|nr:chitotriosidase-1-like [Topomyia yanbarensis]